LFGIDKLLLDMGTEETVVAAEHGMAPVPDKGKKIAKATSAEEGFKLWNLIGQELSEAEKKSYRNTTFPVATSQEPCSLVESMKRPWDVFVTASGRR
jgi:hypothetical protein